MLYSLKNNDAIIHTTTTSIKFLGGFSLTICVFRFPNRKVEANLHRGKASECDPNTYWIGTQSRCGVQFLHCDIKHFGYEIAMNPKDSQLLD